MRRANACFVVLFGLAGLLIGFSALLMTFRPPAPARISATLAPPGCETQVRAAIIGDYGSSGQPTADVAALVASWQPDFVATVGDNNYELGEAETIDAHIGQFYHAFIAPYTGRYGAGAADNRFFPALGNHDWETAGAQPYLDYFTLPGNERYYEVVRGPLHLFIVDSDGREPDGITLDSVQAVWLREALAQSTAPWQLVLLHHPPYNSGAYGPALDLRWPFAAWGADAVLSGHEHLYERLSVDGIPYLINGLGGRSLYAFATPAPESVAQFAGEYGALRLDAGERCLLFRFVTRTGALIDSVQLER